MGGHVRRNGDAFYATSLTPVYPYDIRWCYFTSRPYRLYAHIMDGRTYVHLPCINTPVKAARLLETGESLHFTQKPPSVSGVSRLFVDLPERPSDFPYCVIELELEDETIAFDTLDKL